MKFILIILIVFFNIVIFANDNENSGPDGGSVQEQKNFDNENMSPEIGNDSKKKYKKNKRKYSAKTLYKIGNKNKYKKKYKKAIYYYKRSCKLKYADACYLLAKAYMYNYLKLEKNEAESLKYYKKACKLGLKYSCNKKSKAEKVKERELKRAERKKKRENRVKEKKEKLQKSCEAERSSSCRTLAYIFYRSKDYNNSKIYFKKACDLEDSSSCSDLAEIYLNKDKDIKNAEIYINKSCNSGNKHGCKMKTYLEHQKKCDKNIALSCRSLAEAYIKGNVFNRNSKKALEYYIKACNLEDGDSCRRVADDYYYFSKKEDAKIFYQKACNAKDKKSCKTVRLLKYDIECDNKKGKSCDEVGKIFDNGIGTSKNVRLANKYFKKACELGYKKACNK